MSETPETQETILHDNNAKSANLQNSDELGESGLNQEKPSAPLSMDVLVQPPAKPKNRQGRKPGSMNKATRESKIAKKRFIERANLHADELFDAQLALAKGMNVLMVVRTTGQGKNRKRWTERVTDPWLIQKYLDNELAQEDGSDDYESMDDENHYYYMTTVPPDNKAIDSILNRSFGKAPEKIEVEGGFFVAQKMVVEVIEGHKDAAADNIIEAEPETETSA